MQFAVSGVKGSFESLFLGLEIGNFGFLVLLLGSELASDAVGSGQSGWRVDVPLEFGLRAAREPLRGPDGR